MKSENETRKGEYTGRLAGIVVMVFLALIIIPAGAVMLVLSGLWSALDRLLLKCDR